MSWLARFRTRAGGAGPNTGYGTVLFRDSVVNGLISAAGYGLIFLSFTVLARLLGAEQYGVYMVALAWLNLLVLLAVQGVDQVLLRFGAAYRVKQAHGELRGLLTWSRRIVLRAGLGLALATGLTVYLGRDSLGTDLFLTFLPVCLAILAASQAQLRNFALRSQRRFALAALPEQIFKPLLLMGGVAALHYGWDGANSAAAMWVNLGSVLLSLALMAFWLRGALPDELGRAAPVRRDVEWRRTAWPLLVVTGMHMLQTETDVIMLGWLAGAEPAGIYAAATWVARVIVFGLVIIDSIAAPLFSELYANNQQARLQRLVSLATAGTALSLIPVLAVILVAGDWVLSWFGPAFVSAEPALLILAAAQAINGICGSVVYLLIMSANQKTVAVIFSSSALLNVLGNLLLIPLYGIEGAALATGVSIVAWNLLMVHQVRKRLGIKATLFGVPAGLKNMPEDR